jgi:hypothetical protein
MKKYAITPISTPEFTKGLEYELINQGEETFMIRNNNGLLTICYYKGSMHIKNMDWKIIEK